MADHARLIRWALATTLVDGVLLTASGGWTDPWIWAYAVVWSGTVYYGMASLDDDLARERFKPPAPGIDRLALRAVRLLALAHFLVGSIDVGRVHLTDSVPPGLRAAGLAGMACAILLIFRAMHENRFFSSVVRVQAERGHRVIESGPYSFVRHPGYAGMIAAVPLSALALGSWASLAFALGYAVLIVRRVLVEDAFLREQLAGYGAYAERVQSRLIPGVW